uniref:Uncharacterized protein n=1 Tax=Salix viminalis TaxID=40686 RepID=A0A6N2LRR1_SALVM
MLCTDPFATFAAENNNVSLTTCMPARTTGILVNHIFHSSESDKVPRGRSSTCPILSQPTTIFASQSDSMMPFWDLHDQFRAQNNLQKELTFSHSYFRIHQTPKKQYKPKLTN